MSRSIVAMDTFFQAPLRPIDLKTRFEMMKQAGFDAAYHSDWSAGAAQDEARAQLRRVSEEADLPVAAMYVKIDLAEGHDAALSKAGHVLADLPPGADLEVAVTFGPDRSADDQLDSPEHDERAIAFARALGGLTDATVCLYPHVGFWMQKHATAARIAAAADHERVRCMFCAYHWWAIDEHAELEATLESLAPHLHAINICGVDGVGRGVAKIRPLDDGQLDNATLLGQLFRRGFDGRVAIQGYSLRGDAFARLRHARATCDEMIERVTAHPAWYGG
ncbi:MAG: TIM barrel protein [Planctomycetota bacterium]